jgi:hypothetical protein
LDVGQKDDGSSGCRSDFLIKGVMWAVLKLDGNCPSEREHFASSQISCVKVSWKILEGRQE